MARIAVLPFLASALLTTADAQYGGFGAGNGNGDPPWYNGNGNGNGNNNGNGASSGSDFSGASIFSSQAGFDRGKRILIIHAVLASLVWVIFIPLLAILLRLNVKNPMVLRIHAVGQVLSYVIFIAAAGMGIWLAQQSASFGVWTDPHPRLGLAILAIAFFQPIFGAVHHRIYKKRALNLQNGKATKPPGRTAIGRVHLWLGRLLILAAMVNGGLGIKLASTSPFQTTGTSTKAGIAYGVVAAIMVVLYVIVVIVFEIRRARHVRDKPPNRGQAGATKRTLPTYDESEESVGRSSQSL